MPRNQTITVLQNSHCPAVINVINPNIPDLVREAAQSRLFIGAQGSRPYDAFGFGNRSPALHSQNAA
jgi:hypothetical protein